MLRILLTGVVTFFVSIIFADPPTFSNPQSLAGMGIGSFGGKYYSPLHYDWDEDGDRDMIIGYMATSDGRIRYFENTGSDESPSFSDQGDLKAGGSTISVGGT